jgi:hypothetical protein
MERKNYNSLTQLKNEIERDGKEKVIEFDGSKLLTKRGNKVIRYGLCLGEVSETFIVEGPKHNTQDSVTVKSEN